MWINQCTTAAGFYVSDEQAFEELGLARAAGADAIQVGVALPVWQRIWQPPTRPSVIRSLTNSERGQSMRSIPDSS